MVGVVCMLVVSMVAAVACNARGLRMHDSGAARAVFCWWASTMAAFSAACVLELGVW